MAPGPPGNETTATQLLPPGTENGAKKGSVFCTPSLMENLHTDPKRGPLCGPQNGTMMGPPSLLFCTPRTGLRLHRRRRQDLLGRQTAEGQLPALSISLHPLLRRSAAGRTPRGSAPLVAAVCIYGQGAPLFRQELRWRRHALLAVLLPNPPVLSMREGLL